MPVCPAPCDRLLFVEGMEARVVAPEMAPSNAFRIEAGRGTARFRVDGGSLQSREIGRIGLISGISVSLGGMALYGYGKYQEKPGVRTAGIVGLAIGGIGVLGSLPFLGAGSTGVRDMRGKFIARRFDAPRL